MIQALGFLLMRAATNRDGPILLGKVAYRANSCVLLQWEGLLKYGGERLVKNAEQIVTTPLLCGDSRRGVAAATRCESSRLVTPSHLCILCISKPYMSQCSYRLRVFLFGSRFVFVQHNGKLLGSKYAASRSQASILS